MPHDDRVLDDAAAWAARTGDPAFDDWDGFTAWLERDAAHGDAYDRVMLAAAEAAEALAAESPVAANDAGETEVPRRNRRWFGAALAASVAALSLFVLWPGADGQVYQTAPGESRTIALGDGSSIALSGGSRLVLDDEDPRFARLESGQALFDVRHDDAHPFRVEAGESTLVDAGTIFDVRLAAEDMVVAVSEGVVLFNPTAQNVRLDPGDQLTSVRGSDAYALAEVPLEQVGEWREGRLTFRQATLSQVAHELGRATGIAYRVAPGSEGAPVTGSVLTAPLRDDPRALAPLLGVEVHRAGEDWMIETP